MMSNMRCEITTSGCNLSPFFGPQKFSGEIALVWRVEEDPFGVPGDRIST